MNQWQKRSLVYFALITFAVIAIFPVVWMFVMSVESPHELNHFPPTFWPHHFIFSNYVTVLVKAGIAQGLLNSLIDTGGTLILSIGLALPAAYALAKYDFKGKTALLFAILATQLIPGMASIVPLFDILKSLHLLNTYIGLIFIFTARTLPLNIWILKGFFQSVPMELTEASMVDGCTKFSSLYRIVMPLALPGVAAAAMFTFMQAWIDFIVPLTVLFDQSKFPFTVMLYKFVGDPIMGTNYGLLFASAAIGTLPTLLVFVIFQRFFIRGLVAGSVKG